MNRSTRRFAAAFACAATLATAGLSTTPASAATLDLVLFGDSYTAGNGAGAYTDKSCNRSAKSWGQQYAAQVRAAGTAVNVTDASCSGARVRDLGEQMAAVTPDTDLVALTIGGNDVGFMGIVTWCFLPTSADPVLCRNAVAKAKASLPAVQTATVTQLAQLRAALRPGAKVLVLSYPYLAQKNNYTLRWFLNSFNGGRGVRELGDQGDASARAAIDAANAAAGTDFVTFVPTKDLFVGHEPNPDPYRANSASWIWESSVLSAPEGVYHPKIAGQAAMASAIVRVAGTGGAFGVAQ